MDIQLIGARTAEFLLAEANGERSRALYSLLSNNPAMKAGTIIGADGQQAMTAANARAILYADSELLNTPQKVTAIDRDAEVHGERLVWPVGFTDIEKTETAKQLATFGIVIRWTVRPVGLENDAVLPDDPEPDVP